MTHSQIIVPFAELLVAACCVLVAAILVTHHRAFADGYDAGVTDERASWSECHHRVHEVPPIPREPDGDYAAPRVAEPVRLRRWPAPYDWSNEPDLAELEDALGLPPLQSWQQELVDAGFPPMQPWQQELVDALYERDSDDSFRYARVVGAIPYQHGRTALHEATR